MENKKNKVLTCQDYTVSNENFDLILDEKLDMLITSPQPKEDELSKYYESEAYISHTDASKSLFDKVYQTVKNYTIKQKIKLINSLNSENKTILDIGCGTGDFLEACKNNDWKITGVEPNEGARNLTIKKTEISIHTNIEEILENDSNKFDVITMWHVLEHVPNLQEYITSLKNLLRPNGVLIIAVPNYKSYDAVYYGKFWAAYDVPRHLWHFSQKSINLLFKDFGLELVKTLPMKFDAYYVSLLSEKYKSGQSNPFKAFYRGFLSNLKAKHNMEYSSLIYFLKNTN
ncbi:MAG: methyltransferase domain-containing protein [Flavobacteriaceae bacterium]|nr:methyltransferase domain-containing protein [Flavobacteriaceae bacterium]